MLGSFCDPGGILTPNRWSRNPVRYTVAPQSRFWRVVQKSFLKVAPQSRFWRVVQKSFLKVAPQPLFWRVVQKSFLKVAPQPLFWRVVQNFFLKLAPPHQFHVLVKKTATIRANLLVFSRKNSFFPIILKEIRLLK